MSVIKLFLNQMSVVMQIHANMPVDGFVQYQNYIVTYTFTL